jgi:hypothetical protein
MTWVDMPVTVGGGDEKCVLNRRVTYDLGEPRKILSAYSFHGFDNGDSVESLSVLYAKDGKPLYRRSEHLEGITPDYDAFDPPQPVDYVTDGLILDIVCRVTGENGNTGELSARCHLAVYLEFEEDAEPTCDIPHSEDPRWKGLGQPRNTRDQLQAAKIAVGDRTGKDPLETLALLAKSVRDAGGCAIGPWRDEIAIQRESADDQLHVDGWHAVSFGDGGYTANPKGDAWRYAGFTRCGEPIPPPANEIIVKHHGGTPNAPKFDSTGLVKDFDYCTSVGFVNRGSCPVRPECPPREPCPFPDRAACELLTFGVPVWKSNGNVEKFNDNPWQRRVRNGTWVQVCTGPTITPEVCSAKKAYSTATVWSEW